MSLCSDLESDGSQQRRRWTTQYNGPSTRCYFYIYLIPHLFTTYRFCNFFFFFIRFLIFLVIIGFTLWSFLRILLFTLMRIRILPFTVMRIRILSFNLMRIRIPPLTLDLPFLLNDPLWLPPFHFDVYPDPDSVFHFNLDPDPAFHFDADPD